jgi:hypothetical protein
MILLLNLFGGRDSTVRGIVHDSLLLVRYWGSAGGEDVAAARARYEYLVHRGEDVVWYGTPADLQDGNSVLMQRKLPDGKYAVTFVDGRQREVDSEEMVELLARMLQKKAQ